MFKKLVILFTITVLSCVLASETEVLTLHPDVGLRVPELVVKYGYPLETYTVQTEDNYLLTVHRIPHGKNNAQQTNKPVVFLMHGTLCSSADWVLMGPEKGLAYLLADLGYDVWMGNARGNFYSRNHVSLNPDTDKKFWNFSWHEIGYYDLPAMINRVLAETEAEKIFYIGHSQGTASFFVMASSRPEYNQHIKLMVAFGPAAYVGHTPNIFLRLIAPLVDVVGWITKFLGQNELLPSSEFIRNLNALMCDEDMATHPICSNILFLIAGYDKEQLNETMVPVIISNVPAGSATKQMLHFGQEVNSKKFRQYDYYLFNWFHYGTLTPPKYDISKITAPVALFSGKNDILVSFTDVDRLDSELPNSVLNHKIEYQKFSHLDFLWANDVVKLLYNDVFALLNQYV